MRTVSRFSRCAQFGLALLLAVALLPGCFLKKDDDDDDDGDQVVSVKVVSEKKIAFKRGGLGGSLKDGDEFGSAVAAIGDLGGGEPIVSNDPEQDGVDDLAVGVPGDDTSSENAGNVRILFMKPDGNVSEQHRITSKKGGFGGDLDANDRFGSAVTALSDLDGDGVDELVAGAPGDDGKGAVWVLFMEVGGHVHAQQKISDNRGHLDATLKEGDAFGAAVASLSTDLGDFNTDGIADLLVGLPGRKGSGAVWILHLGTDGHVITKERISEKHGEFDGNLDDGDDFGRAVAAIGDLDDDGVVDLAVGAPGDDDTRGDNQGDDRGAVWILFMNSDGTVRRERKISDDKGGFSGKLKDGDRFGTSLAALGDLDGDGNEDIAVGAPGADDSSTKGSIWILFLRENGKVRSRQRIGYKKGGFDGKLDDGDAFGAAIANIGNFDALESTDLAVGAPGDDQGGTDRGAAWLLYLGEPK